MQSRSPGPQRSIRPRPTWRRYIAERHRDAAEHILHVAPAVEATLTVESMS
jgi:hypothetical protein